MKSVLSALALASAAGTFSACVVVDSQAHVTREEKRFTVSGAPDLKLTTFDGSIEVRAGDAKTVIVEIEKRGPTREGVDQLRVETKQDGNRIEVEVKRPAREVVTFGIGISASPTAKLIVTMPRDGNLTAKSGDGSIRVESLHGRLELRTGDGSIRGRDLSGQMIFSTGDGSVTLDEANGDVEIDTGDGSVSVSGKLGAVKLHTSDGTITFRADAGTTMSDDWSLTTGDGSIALYLPSDFAAELDAHTGDGSIRNDLKLEAEAERSERDESSRRTLRAKLGAGGKTLKIRTGDGSIRLKSN
jgi:DUF4097 and DUF4098 domain-containing protein YvlB